MVASSVQLLPLIDSALSSTSGVFSFWEVREISPGSLWLFSR